MRLDTSGESGPPWGVPSTLGLTSPFFHHPGVQERPDEVQQPLVLDSFSHLPHQFVVIDSIEKPFQVEIDHPAVARGDILLRQSYRLMS